MFLEGKQSRPKGSIYLRLFRDQNVHTQNVFQGLDDTFILSYSACHGDGFLEPDSPHHAIDSVGHRTMKAGDDIFNGFS